MIQLQVVLDLFKKYPVAVVCFVISAICFFLMYTRSGAIEELTLEEEVLGKRLVVLGQNVRNANGLEEDLKVAELLVEQVDARLFDREQRAVNINFFYGLEDRLPIRMASIAQMEGLGEVYGSGGPRGLQLYEALGYNMTIDGRFSEILQFLFQLHRVDPLIRVGDLHLTTAGNGQAGGELQARVKVMVLARK